MGSASDYNSYFSPKNGFHANKVPVLHKKYEFFLRKHESSIVGTAPSVYRDAK
jgi:hypothetical protein